MLNTDTLLGGWCDIYRKDRKYPISAKVNLDEYNKGQSTWRAMPKTMIRKVAIVQAFREAFPGRLQSMYTEEEFQDATVVEPEQEVEREIENKANRQAIKFEAPEQRSIATEQKEYKQQEETAIQGDDEQVIMEPDF